MIGTWLLVLSPKLTFSFSPWHFLLWSHLCDVIAHVSSVVVTVVDRVDSFCDMQGLSGKSAALIASVFPMTRRGTFWTALVHVLH